MILQERGRQRTQKKNPSRQSMGDKYVAELIMKKTSLVSSIESTQEKIDNLLDDYNTDNLDFLKELSEQLSTLKTSLEDIETKLT